jgi:hypothetical protein
MGEGEEGAGGRKSSKGRHLGSERMLGFAQAVEAEMTLPTPNERLYFCIRFYMIN